MAIQELITKIQAGEELDEAEQKQILETISLGFEDLEKENPELFLEVLEYCSNYYLALNELRTKQT